MFERIKTILLAFLVCYSFYLTYQLVENRPPFETLTPAEYEMPQKIGEAREWLQLIHPQEMIFHFNKKQTKALPGMAQYHILWEDRKGQSLKGLQTWKFTNAVEKDFITSQLRFISQNREGIQFIFRGEIPTQILNRGVNLPEQVLDGMKSINRIWIYQEEPLLRSKALFISDEDKKVFEAQVDEGNNFNLSNLVLLGSHLKEQISPPSQFLYYIPQHELSMNQWTYDITTIDALTMAKALFLDISVMREIKERDGSYIFTDGSKSLQTKTATADMRYYVPTYENFKTQEERVDIIQSLDFINLHQGWTGDYRLDDWQKDQEGETIIYREYLEGYPIYGSQEESHLGQIVLKYNAHQISEYSRSLIQFKSGRGIPVKVISGEQLLELLEDKGINLNSIRNIELAYMGDLLVGDTSKVILRPVYVISFLHSKETLIIDGRGEERS